MVVMGLLSSLGLLLGGLGLVLAVALGAVPRQRELVAMLMLGAPLMLSGGLGLVFALRRPRADEAPRGPTLARWTYDAATWAALLRAGRAEASHRAVVGAVLATLSALAGLWAVLTNDALLPFAAMMLGIAVFFAVLGIGLAADATRLMSTAAPEVVITRAGVSFLGRLECFNGVTSVLDGVGLHPDQSNILVFCFRRLSGRPLRLRPETLEVPVPSGARGEAEGVARAFGKPLSAAMLAALREATDSRRG
jgi:hypothetical protein